VKLVVRRRVDNGTVCVDVQGAIEQLSNGRTRGCFYRVMDADMNSDGVLLRGGT